MSIVLVPYDRHFLDLLYEWRHEDVVKKFNPVEFLPMESLHERYAAAHSDFSNFESGELFFWFVQAGGQVVGNISLRNINRTMLTAEIGYGIASYARGKGYATAAVRLMTEDAFRRTPLRKLLAYVHDENTASIRVLEKAGYTREGLLREHYLVNGVPANEIVYGILRREVVT